MDIRALQYQVRDHRPDILARRALICLQNAARKVCEETLIVRDMRTAAASTGVTGFAFETRISFPDAVITGLKAPDGSDDTTLYGVIRILGVTLGKSTDPNAVSKPMEVALPLLMAHAEGSDKPDAATSFPGYWADDSGTLVLFPTMVDGNGWDQVRVKVALSPIGNDFESIPLPLDVSEAIVQGALGEAYNVEGPRRDVQMALMSKRAFEALWGQLKTRMRVGTSGAHAQHRNDFDFKLR